MPNKLKGAVSLDLSDGRTLTLSYEFDGLIALEEASGMKMPEVYAELMAAERDKSSISMRLQRAIIYGGLHEHHPEMTLRDAGQLLLTEASSIERAFKALQGANGPDGEGGDGADADADPPKRTAGTGGSSSKAGAQRASNRTASGGKRHGRTVAR